MQMSGPTASILLRHGKMGAWLQTRFLFGHFRLPDVFTVLFVCWFGLPLRWQH